MIQLEDKTLIIDLIDDSKVYINSNQLTTLDTYLL